MIAAVEKDEMRKNTKVMNFVIQSENWDGGEETANGGIGIARGMFVAPDDIDESNDEVLRMFGIA